MKTLRKLSLPLQGIGITAVLLLLTQSAFAIGTDEDTDVNNRATVNYDVGGVGQELIESAPGLGNDVPGATNGTDTVFEVDRKIDFELTGPAGNTIIVPNELRAVLTFTLTNSGNDEQDFGFSVSNQGGDFDMNDITSTLDIFVDAAPFDGVYVLADDTATFVDELPPDGVTTATIFVVADADNPTPINTWTADLELVVNAHDGNDGATGGAIGALAADHSAIADDSTLVQNVFAELGATPSDNAFEATGTYEVQSATLTILKTSAVILDPFSAPGFYKAIPGATVEYTITITNNGIDDADLVSITDTLNGNLTLVFGQYGGQDVEVDIGSGTTIINCTLDAGDVDLDGCGEAAGVLTIAPGGGFTVGTVAADNPAVITFQATID